MYSLGWLGSHAAGQYPRSHVPGTTYSTQSLTSLTQSDMPTNGQHQSPKILKTIKFTLQPTHPSPALVILADYSEMNGAEDGEAC